MVKIVVFALICAFIVIYLKSINSEYSLVVAILSGILILTLSFEYLYKTYAIINDLIDMSGVDKELYVIIFKISALGYLIEFSADTITDFGLKSLADKLVFVGKIVIFSVSLPIIYAVFNLLKNLAL